MVPGIYVGGHEAAVAEVTTGGLQQVCWRCGGSADSGPHLCLGPPLPARHSPIQKPIQLCFPPLRPSQSDFRFMAGVVAWEPGQLAREVAAGAWITAASSRSLVLKQCLQLPVPLWREAMALLGGDYAAAAKAARRDEEGSDSDDE